MAVGLRDAANPTYLAILATFLNALLYATLC